MPPPLSSLQHISQAPLCASVIRILAVARHPFLLSVIQYTSIPHTGWQRRIYTIGWRVGVDNKIRLDDKSFVNAEVIFLNCAVVFF